MRYENSDAIPVKRNITKEEFVDLSDLIKAAIYCDLRQRFEIAEVCAIYQKIDDAVFAYEIERKLK